MLKASYVRLVTTYLMEYFEDWTTSRAYPERGNYKHDIKSGHIITASTCELDDFCERLFTLVII